VPHDDGTARWARQSTERPAKSLEITALAEYWMIGLAPEHARLI